MEKLIRKTIETEMMLDEKVKADVEKEFNTLSIDAILTDPSQALHDFGEKIIESVFIKHAPAYIENGIQFSDAVKNKKKPLNVEAIPSAGS